MLINYGAAVSHTVARAAPLIGQERIEQSTDPYGEGLISFETVEKLAATTLTAEHNRLMVEALELGIEQGALGVGIAIQYIPAADRTEIYRVFQVAAASGLTVFAHQRSAGLIPPDSVESLQELLANAVASGAGLHVCHLGSSGLKQAPLMLEMIQAARSRGLDVTTEVYPYAAAMAVYGSPLLKGDWRERFGIDFSDLESIATHERLTEDSFERGRLETPDDPIVVFVIPKDTVDLAVAHPDVIVASDAVDVGRHPRTAGTFSRVLGHYVRDSRALTLMQALAKMTIMPAQRLEKAVPQMALKGRLKVGADADITVFDPHTIADRATFANPAARAVGVRHVLVGGVPVLLDGRLVDGVLPGKPVRRAVEQ
jgi:dihydroorotase